MGKFFPVTDIDSPLSLYLSMFSLFKNTSRFLEIVRSLFTMLILVEWYQMWYNCRTPLYCPSFTTEVVFISVALVAKPRVASQYHFNEKPHTIAYDMVSHHVIMVIFVLLATRSIQKTVPLVGWYILPPKWQK